MIFTFLILTIKMTLMKPSQSKQIKFLGKQAKCLRANNKTFAALPQKVGKVNALLFQGIIDI